MVMPDTLRRGDNFGDTPPPSPHVFTYLLNPKGLRAKIVDLLILKGLKSFVFNIIRYCL